MRKVSSGLLTQIEVGALDSGAPLADTLRKCVALGGRSGSTELRDWARRELNGYKGEPEESIPAYRVVPAILAIDAQNLAYRVTGQQISTWELPEFARETIKPEVPLTYGVAEMEVLAAKTKDLTLQHPQMQDLVSYMNATNESTYVINRLYWKVGPTHVHGVVDAVRTMLVALVAELRAAGIEEQPNAESVDHAVHVIVHGAKRSTFNIHTSHVKSDGGDVAVQHSSTRDGSGDDQSWVPSWVRWPWGVSVGAAGLISAAVGVAAWTGWNPFS